MAIIYFTNNSDSGDGTLRSAISNASSGDTIAPDPSIANELITISLSSTITVNKTLVFNGGSNRVRLDGQGSVRVVQVTSSSASVTFNNFDFVNGYNNSTCGGICATVNGPELHLNRCLIAGIENANLGDIGSVSSTAKWNVVEIENCIFCGGNIQALSTARISSRTIKNSTFAGYVTNSKYTRENSIAVTNEEAQTAGFLVPPPLEITDENWNRSLWLEWDFRLKPNSQFISGNTSEFSVDFLGHTRETNGAIGAIDGSWIVLNENDTETLSEETTIDYLELHQESTLVLQVPDVALRVRKNADIFGGQVNGTSSFVVVPYETNTELANTNEAFFVQYGAGVSNLTANTVNRNTAQLSWNQNNSEIPVIVQVQDGTVWNTVSVEAIEELTVSDQGSTVVGQTYRIFDGETFLTVTIEPVVYIFSVQYQVVSGTVASVIEGQDWEAVSQIIGVDDMNEVIKTGQAVTILARIYDAFDNNEVLVNTGSNIESVHYTCERKTKGLYTLDYTPVEGHDDVNVSDTCVLESLVTDDDAWNIDTIGYNFLLTPDTRNYNLFDVEGSYRFKITVNLTAGNPITFYREVHVQG